MSKNRDKFKALAAAGGLVLAAGTAGLILSGAASQAQERTQERTTSQTTTAQPARQSFTHMTYTPAQTTPSQTTAAQDTKTANTKLAANSKLTYAPAKDTGTAQQPTVYETRTVVNPDGSKSTVRTPVRSPNATTDASTVKVQNNQTVDPKLSASNTNLAAGQGSSSAATKPATNVAVRPTTPVLLRKPLPPGKVQWSNAIAQSNRMKSLRQSPVIARVPKATLDRTRLPVILPRTGGTIDTAQAKMVSFGDAYALNLPQAKGVQITMYGNRAFVPTDKGAISARPVQKLAGVAEDIRITQMEDGWTATFTRYGVVYSLDVSCDDINSADCKTDAFIRKAVAQFDDVTVGADAQAEADGKLNADGKAVGPLDGLFNAFNKMSKGG